MATPKTIINFRIKPKENEKLEEMAKTKDITKSELIRIIIENYLKIV